MLRMRRHTIAALDTRRRMLSGARLPVTWTEPDGPHLTCLLSGMSMLGMSLRQPRMASN